MTNYDRYVLVNVIVQLVLAFSGAFIITVIATL